MLNYNHKALFGFSTFFLPKSFFRNSANMNIQINSYELEVSTNPILSKVITRTY